MRLCSCVLVLLLLLPVAGRTADRTVTVLPLPELEIQPLSPVGQAEAVLQACVVGNATGAAWAIPGFIVPPESYFLAFDPADDCTACGVGLQVQTVHIGLQTSEAMTLIMSCGLRSAEIDQGCTLVGASECLSGPYQIEVPSSGAWNIGLPLTCECAYVDYSYLLEIRFLEVTSASGAVPDLVTDAAPVVCTSWNEFGGGVVDLVTDYGFPGNLMIWADAACCEQPVGAEGSSMGRWKGGYDE